MKPGLHYSNLLGVLALALLCVLQWQHDRRLNLQLNQSERLRGEQAAKIGELEAAQKGLNEDLGQIKQAFSAKERAGAQAEHELALNLGTNQLLKAEQERLKSALSNYAQTVAIQNERIKEANHRIEGLASNLNESIRKFNDLVTNYNGVVGELNALRRAGATNSSP
jgi:chromosome segregation ATPase